MSNNPTAAQPGSTPTEVQPIPCGLDHTIPYLTVRDPAKAIDFYIALFGATEAVRMPVPGTDRIMHAELRIRNSTLMLGGESDEYGTFSPLAFDKLPPVSLMLYMEDTDAVFAKAVSMGAKPLVPPADMFWGDRFCKFVDPFGHVWAVATHVRNVTPEECAAAAATCFKDP